MNIYKKWLCHIFNTSKSYFLITILSFVLLNNVHSQIHYFDLEPDVPFYGTTERPLDINNDGIIDFWFTTESTWDEDYMSWGYETLIKTTENSKIEKNENSAKVFQEGEQVKPSIHFYNDDNSISMQAYLSGTDLTSGNWIDVEEGYLGARIKVDNEYHYAWIKVYSTTNRRFWIDEYSYNSAPNSPITTGFIPDGATTVKGKAEVNYFDGRDIEVSFLRAKNESDYSEYRTFLAKANDNNATSLDFLNQLPPERYHNTIVQSSDTNTFVSFNLNSTTVDINGDSIESLTDYQIHILNVDVNGVMENNILSFPSSHFQLQIFLTAVSEVLASDIDNNNSSSDIYVSFKSIENDQYIKEYRVYINKYYHTTEFDLEAAVSLPTSSYMTVYSGSDTIELTLKENQLDSEGNPIEDGVYYQAYVLTVPDSIHSLSTKLSTPSNRIFLSNQSFFSAGLESGEHVNYHVCDSLFSKPQNWIEGNLDIDLNRDGLADFQLYHSYSEGGSAGNYNFSFIVKPLRNNKILKCRHTEHEDWAEILEFGDPITDNDYWTNNETILKVFTSSTSGVHENYGHYESYNFTNLIPAYIGLCVMDYENPQYAWLNFNQRDLISYGFVDINSGYIEIEKEQQFSISPNPANHYIKIKATKTAEESLKYKCIIYNSLGLQIQEIQTQSNHETIDISQFKSGVYTIVFYKDNSKIEVQKFIVF